MKEKATGAKDYVKEKLVGTKDMAGDAAAKAREKLEEVDYALA